DQRRHPGRRRAACLCHPCPTRSAGGPDDSAEMRMKTRRPRSEARMKSELRIAEAILRAVADLDGGRWPGVADRLCHCRQFAAVPSRHASKGDREPAKLACGSPWTRELEACSLSFWVRE